jgi:DNA-binding response OmpR family regulator
MKLLILEDSTTDAELTRRGLACSMPDCEIDIAPTIKMARLMLLEGTDYDIAFLDMKLPDGEGLELLREIRQTKLNMAEVMLTGLGDDEVAATALKAGANDYVVKHMGYISQLPEIIDLAIKNYKQSLL